MNKIKEYYKYGFMTKKYNKKIGIIAVIYYICGYVRYQLKRRVRIEWDIHYKN